MGKTKLSNYTVNTADKLRQNIPTGYQDKTNILAIRINMINSLSGKNNCLLGQNWTINYQGKWDKLIIRAKGSVTNDVSHIY